MFFFNDLSSRFPWTLSGLFIVGAPMRVLAGPALAVAISEAGGLGFIGPGPKTQDTIQDLEVAAEELRKLRALNTARLYGLSSAYNLMPVGVGFQLWNDDVQKATEALRRLKPCAVWLYAPRHGQRELDEWSSKIRAASPDTEIWVQIGTLREVQELLQSPQRPDAIVVQGIEAGGHGHRNGIGLMSLLPEVSDILRDSGILVIAAGGIADGRGVAAALCLGARGVALGTRFLAATEARISGGYQAEIIRATDGGVSTIRTLLYNHLRGTTGWPKAYIPRGVINRSWIDHQEGVAFDDLKKLHDEAATVGDAGWGPQGRLATYAGASLGLIREVKSATEIIVELEEGAFETLKVYREPML